MTPVDAIEDRVTAAQRWRDAKDYAHTLAIANADSKRDDRIAEAQAADAARPRPQDKPQPAPRPARAHKVDVVT